MIDPEAVLVVTTDNVPGYRVYAMLGEVFGSTSQSSHGSVAALGASLNPRMHGELVHLTKTGNDARTEALARLKRAAAEKGANAVVAMRYTMDSISELGIMAIAYGTAVVLVRE
jgi:uncharacterized protein YbjQ (UPF0145 family)